MVTWSAPRLVEISSSLALDRMTWATTGSVPEGRMIAPSASNWKVCPAFEETTTVPDVKSAEKPLCMACPTVFRAGRQIGRKTVGQAMHFRDGVLLQIYLRATQTGSEIPCPCGLQAIAIINGGATGGC